MMKKTLLLFFWLCAASAFAMALRPRITTQTDYPPLEKIIPKQFGEWRYIPSSLVQVSAVVAKPGETSMDQPYDDSISRTYVDNAGHAVMLTIAYGKNQRQEVKIHRPELCYPAQGFAVSKIENTTFPISTTEGAPITGKRMVANTGRGPTEIVSYWIRIGDEYSNSAWKTRLKIIKEGLAGKLTDGVLVRVSQRVPVQDDYTDVYQRQERFAKQLVEAMPEKFRPIIVK